MKIGWWVGSDAGSGWAFENLARHVQGELLEYEHAVNAPGDINVVLAPVFLGVDVAADGACVLHLDGNRWLEGQGVLKKGLPQRVLHLVWALNAWSWGLVWEALALRLADRYEFCPLDFSVFAESRTMVHCHQTEDVFFCQNVTQLAAVPDGMMAQTIVRVGGVMNFCNNARTNRYMRQMRKCAAVIATNNHLLEIARAANNNAYLIPNGIDTGTWRPDPDRRWRASAPVIGFIGNISTPAKRAYKGYDFVETACIHLGLELKTALYQDGQIPHDEMKAKFWDRIDLFVLPTDGEGCSNSIMEALACGVPVITTRTSGYHGERLVHGREVYFAQKSAAGIVRAIQAFIDCPLMFGLLSANGRRFAEANHDIDHVAAQYRQVFDRHFAPMTEADSRALYCEQCGKHHQGLPPCEGCEYAS